jgi:hypothetical protein
MVIKRNDKTMVTKRTQDHDDKEEKNTMVIRKNNKTTMIRKNTKTVVIRKNTRLW